MMTTAAASLRTRTPRWALDLANLSTRGYALATVSSRPVPDFLVVGTKRGGTTSLFNYLLEHPGVLGLFPRPRERKSTDFFFKDQGRGERWYRSHFHTRVYRRRLAARLGYEPVGGEASPYYMWDPRVPARVQEVAPQVKSIALLRDPVERAWSHYHERRQNGVEPLSFTDALAREEARTGGELERMLADPGYYSEAYDWYSYRQRGVYLPQLRTWEEHFPADQLLVLRSEDLYADVQGVFDQVCDFLGVGRFQLPDTQQYNAAPKPSSLPEDVREDLESFYAPHNAALEQHLGRSLNWSS